ncbi:curli-like amyloid fiber formation chaperone CsgH [Lutibacter sp.]|uniref:curli-like amyloid fiber formation chaperone CsgH n=1 Tax=Lutibacter sp. TaxID=1925666 RepID=UPI003566367C
MSQLKIHIVLCCLLLSFNQVYSQLNEAVKGKINIQESDNLILIRAQIENEEPLFKNNLYYNLVALKKNASGNYSSNKQEGEFSLNPEESKTVSEIRLNLNEDEDLRIYLFVKHENILVSKDSIYILPQKQQQAQKKIVKEADFVLKGIVIDEVLTKIGKDFHDYFYQEYLTSGTQYPFIITIAEKPYFGTSSIISVKVDDRVLFEFISKPDEEFLKSNVKISLQNLSQYSKQRKMLFKNSRI